MVGYKPIVHEREKDLTEGNQNILCYEILSLHKKNLSWLEKSRTSLGKRSIMVRSEKPYKLLVKNSADWFRNSCEYQKKHLGKMFSSN